eukprot:gene11619-12677_t
MTHFKKINLNSALITYINDKGEEKKKLAEGQLPKGWTDENFDYVTHNKNNKRGNNHIVPTGKVNNITVLDFDTMELYNEACRMVPDLHTYYSVATRRGRHVYFEYDETITNSKVGKIDVQNDGKCVFGLDTIVRRHDGHSYIYQYMGGKIKKMPKVLKDWCCNVTEATKKSNYKDYESNIDYQYQVTDEECREVGSHGSTIDKMDIWDEYSEKYDCDNYNKRNNMKIWNGLKLKISINFFCKLLDIPFFKYHKQVPDDELYNEVVYYDESLREITKKYIEITWDDFCNNDTIILESGTGTGKTTCVSKMIKLYKDDNWNATVLSIVNLISLADQQKLTFAKHDIKLQMYNEKEVTPAIIIANDAVICINSLWKLHDCNFRNKIVYIDEIYSLCMTLTHNDKLGQQRLIYSTLYRMLTECKKLIVSDAHIHNNVMKLLEKRLNDETKTYVHYVNYYRKFREVPAVRYNDENQLYDTVLQRVNNVLSRELFRQNSSQRV